MAEKTSKSTPKTASKTIAAAAIPLVKEEGIKPSSSPIKTANKPANTSPAPAMKPRPARAVKSAPPTPVTVAERARMIREAAYYRAERRNFAPGFEMQDWSESEREIDERLRREGRL